jgi:hypothetical protein
MSGRLRLQISACASGFGLAAYCLEQALDENLVSTGTDDQLAVDTSTKSRKLGVRTCLEHRAASLRFQDEDEGVSREPVPAGELYTAPGNGFDDLEPGQRRALVERERTRVSRARRS